MIQTAVLNFLLEIAVISFIFPVVFVLVWKMRHHKSFRPVFIGMGAYFVFSQLFTSIPYMILIQAGHPIGKAIRSNALALALCTGLITAILEEFGRLVAFKRFMTEQDGKERETAISYGLGHAGLACMFTLGWGNLQYYVAATLINSNDATVKELPATILNVLKGMTSADCILNGLIAVASFALQIALSVMIFQAFRNSKLCKRLMAYAIGLHTIFYLPQGLYDIHVVPKAVEFVLALVVMAAAVTFAAHIYHEMGVKEEEQKKKTKRKGTSAPDEKNWAVANKKLSDIPTKK